MTIWTRSPELEDAQPLARMVDQVWRATYGSMLPQQFWDSYPTAQRASELRESITDRAQRGVVAETDDALVGWPVSTEFGGQTLVGGVYVRVGWRRGGCRSG